MSEQPVRQSRWFGIGSLLPAEVRQRLFEPAYYDLVREELAERKGARGWPFGLRAVWLLLASSAQGVVFFLQDRQRRRKFAIGLAWTAGIITVIMALLLREWIGSLAAHLTDASIRE